MLPKLMLIDGNSLINRAYYALPPLNTAEGVPTGAVFGFLNMFFKLLDDERPDRLAVAFDLSGPTFRHGQFQAYKANRTGMPDDLRPQLPMLKEALAALAVPTVELQGYEADDLIGTLSARAEAAGWETVIVTGDRDALQLISPKTTVLLTRRGISEVKRYDEAALREDYGLRPEQIIDLKGLMGDTSDNIPGVPGVGEKTALKLVQQFGSVEAVLENLDQVGGKKLPETLAANREQALLSKKLATIDRDVPLELDIGRLEPGEPDRARARALFRRWEFRSLLRRLGGDGRSSAQPPSIADEPSAADERGSVDAPGGEDAPAGAEEGPAAVGERAGGRPAESADAGEALPAIRPAYSEAADLSAWREAVDAWPTGATAAVAAAQLEAPAEPGQRGAAHRPAGRFAVGACVEPGRAHVFFARSREEAVAALAAVWGRPGLLRAAHAAKPLLLGLLRSGHAAAAPDFDASIAAYLIHSERTNFRLEALAREYRVGDLPAAEDAGVLPFEAGAGAGSAGAASVGAASAGDPADGEPAPGGDAPPGGDSAGGGAERDSTRAGALAYVAAAAHCVRVLVDRMAERLRSDGLERLFREVELPLCETLAWMEFHGVRIERAGLDEMAAELERRIDALTQEIYRLAGQEFNVNSTKQLGEVLFVKLGLPVLKKTKTGFSTDSEVLEALAPRHEIAARVLEHRTLVKLKGTYVDGLRTLVDARTGRVHTTFHQTVAATGRLSSSDPGLQNIPIRLEEGRRIRKVFAAEPGYRLLTADYSQIELRILAHVAADPGLQAAFHAGHDIHTRTASEIFGVPMEAVTREQRTVAKAVNFSIAYGVTDFGLARNVGIGRAEAKAFIDTYFARYPGIKAYMDRTIAECRQAGYVTTLLGRRRYLPDINSRNHNLRNFAERMAINTPIQGTAADILKLAMVALHRALTGADGGRAWRSRMILTVHDELVFEAPPEELPELARLVRNRMEDAMRLDVPLKVEVKTGPNWYDLTPVEVDAG